MTTAAGGNNDSGPSIRHWSAATMALLMLADALIALVSRGGDGLAALALGAEAVVVPFVVLVWARAGVRRATVVPVGLTAASIGAAIAIAIANSPMAADPGPGPLAVVAMWIGMALAAAAFAATIDTALPSEWTPLAVGLALAATGQAWLGWSTEQRHLLVAVVMWTGATVFFYAAVRRGNLLPPVGHPVIRAITAVMPLAAALAITGDRVIGHHHVNGLSVVALGVLVVVAACREALAHRRVVGMLRQLRSAEAQLKHAASHDRLTGLPTREYLLDQAASAINGGVRTMASVAFDLHNLRALNDIHGPAAGDRLIADVAWLLLTRAPAGALTGRLGGGEFVQFLPAAVSTDEAVDYANTLLIAIRRLPSATRLVTASAGVSWSGDQPEPAELLRQADVALCSTDNRDSGRALAYDPSAEDRIPGRRRAELEEALCGHQFRLVYQPLVAAATDSVRGFEALLRWHHPDRGLIPPCDFIGELEASDLMVDVGAWVLEEACRQTALWRTLYACDISVSVNASPRQLRSAEFIQTVAHALRRSHLPARALVLEVTESSMVTDPEVTGEVLRAISDMGVRIALDDFGTGYSSLSFLRDFPVDVVKIDRSLVQDTGSRAGRPSLAEALLGMILSLGLTAVAEGVETAQQRDVLRDRGCPLIQGFFYFRPLSPEDAAALLAPRQQQPRIIPLRTDFQAG